MGENVGAGGSGKVHDHAMNERRRVRRVLGMVLPLLAAMGALTSLVVAVEAGLDRLGVGVAPASAVRVPHGALMVGGFVGTLVAMERARAAGWSIAYAAPLLSAAGAISLVAGYDEAGRVLFTGAALALAVLMAWFWRIQPQLPIALVAMGAVAWAGATVTWGMTGSPVRAVPWWGAFLLLTILGERLELTRFARRSTLPARAAAVATLLGLGISVLDWTAGARVVGASFVLAGVWLLWADTARVTVRRGGLASYAGAALIAAYAWLTFAGIVMLTRGLVSVWYDATLHALFIGFVIGSIFAHGPIIFPALTGQAVRLTPVLVVALVGLHASVGVRVVAAIANEPRWREIAAHLHVLAFLLYLGGMMIGVLLARRAHSSRRTATAATGNP